MSISPEEQAALDILKGKENPFESLVRPQRADDQFLDLHVPALLKSSRDELLEIIDTYRVEEYTRIADLKPTRVVTVLGNRGAGKTHLMRSLEYRDDSKFQLMVRPSYYQPDQSFEEYLLSQLVSALTEDEEVHGTKPFVDISEALVRRLLRHSLLSLGPTERIFATSPRKWSRFRLLWGSGETLAHRFDALGADLVPPYPKKTLRELVRFHGFEPEECFRVVEGHLRKFEVGQDTVPVIRRQLYSAMARTALLGESEGLNRVLTKDYLLPEGGLVMRSEVVAELLQVLIETCAIVRLPVVFAYDNLERLFKPRNQLDGGLVRMFFNCLAQAVDGPRGIIVLLFTERGLYEQIHNFKDQFAVDRLSQGVLLPARNPVDVLTLQPPSGDEIALLIRARLRPLLPEQLAQKLSNEFPFKQDFLNTIIAEAPVQNLRATLLRLRDQYANELYGRKPLTEGQPPPLPTADPKWLELVWKKHVSASNRKLQGSLVSHFQSLHTGLGMILDLLKPLTVGGWFLTQVQPTVSVGEHAIYGVVTILDWAPESQQVSPNGETLLLRLGIGMLLATTRGMAADLKAKFDALRKRSLRVNNLIILWATQVTGEDLSVSLPRDTRTAWDDSGVYKKRTTLRRVSRDELAMLLAYPDWYAEVKNDAEHPASEEVIQQFIRQACDSLCQLICPPVTVTERSTADED